MTETVPGNQVGAMHRRATPRSALQPARASTASSVLGALSPSRASDFRSCPLQFRFRTIDRLPEPVSPAAMRGNVVHKVLEDLFDLSAPERTPERAQALVQQAWEQVLAVEPGAAEMFAGEAEELTAWLASCRESLARYFDLEDPRRLEPAHREEYVETLLESRLLLRGVVDRIDVAPDGAIRVVDYKTGRSPAVGFEGQALFQMRFYALVIWRTRGVVPALLRLIYLGDGEMVSYVPDEADLLATERLVAGALGGDPHRPRDRRLAAQSRSALHVVLVPAGVPGLRRHPAAAPGARGATGRARHAAQTDAR